MSAFLICIFGFIAAYWAGRRSLAMGCVVVVAVGCSYGIVRANIGSPFSHFTFDATLIGLYLAQFVSRKKNGSAVVDDRQLSLWAAFLVVWPALLLLLPFQTFMVSLVGLRGNMFMLPALWLGARLNDRDLRLLSVSFAVINLITLGFAVAEYFMGIEPFFPYGPTTTTIYASYDGADHNRIPSTFGNAHSYAAVMCATIPFLFGAWSQRIGGSYRKALLVAGMGSALLGVLMASTRMGILLAVLLIAVASMTGKLSVWKRAVWVVAVGILVYGAITNERWQRYKNLGDSGEVTGRIAGSVNRTFIEILFDYPMGNGLGGGGTSIPYFLAGQVKVPIAVENEYSRILLEQGRVGLLGWVGFAIWFLTRRAAFASHPWLAGRRLAWWLCAFGLVTAAISNGLLTSIPNTFMVMLAIGWVSTKPKPPVIAAVNPPRGSSAVPVEAAAWAR